MYSNTVLFEKQYGDDFDPSQSSILTTMKKHNFGEKQNIPHHAKSSNI
jgi:hypothetical protein